MFIEEEFKKYKDYNIRVYLDMDGTIAHYDVNKACDFDIKRPLFDRIDKIKYIYNKYNNITFYILSIGNLEEHVEEKNKWLDIYLPEIEKENRIIMIRNKNSQITSAEVKKNYLNNLKTDDKIILIDDDPRVLGAISKNNLNNVILYKDSILSD